MELNKEQLQAIKHKNGPLLIVAGAGTGKTTVITERIKYLIEEKFARPEEILALTFTEKAAKEMEERVDQALPYGTFGMWIITFHSFCDRILKSEALHIGLNPHFKLLSEAETHLLVKKNFWKFKLDHFRPSGNPYKFIDGMIQHFSRLKDEDVSVEDYLVIASGAKQSSNTQEQIASSQAPRNDIIELANAYKVYEQLKIDEGVMDFGDLISNALKLFRLRKNVLKRYQEKFKYILVDEFQDTNFAQNELVKLLVNEEQNITVVADDDQAIYRFRGAAISNVIQFRQSFPKTKIITLTKNYRSTQEILDRAYQLIQNNNPDRLEIKEKIDKKLIGKISGGEKISFIHTDRVEQEAENVINKIKDLRSKDYEYKDFAILVRANNHADPFVRALERAKIPYQFLGPGQLFKQSEVKDLIAYLKVLTDFTDSVSLYRVLSMDIFNFKQRDLIAVLNRAKKQNLSLFEQLENEELFKDFVKIIHRHQELVNKETGGQILYYFLEDSGLLKSIVNWEETKAQNISKFFDKLKTYESVNNDASVFSLVEYLNLAMDLGESPMASEIDWSGNNAVNILTIHSAKGLEFPIVFLVNLVEGRFPTRERKEQIPIPDSVIKDILPEGDYHLQEERRLFYVGMTRVKEKLYFSAANFYGEGKRERKLSPFVTEAGVKITPIITNESQIPLFEWSKTTEKIPNSKFQILNSNVDYLSYSAIQSFRDCPLHYKLRYILRIPTPTTAPLSFGSSVHTALNEFYLQKADIQNCLKNNWIIEGYSSKKHEEESFEKAKRFLTEYLKTGLHKNANPIYLEQTFMFKLDDLKIGGKIDRIDQNNNIFEIIDYKTGANIPTQKDIDSDLQMTIYALAATNMLQKPIKNILLSFYYFDNQTKVSTIRTVEQLEEAKKELFAIRDEIQQSDFLCSGSRICENCEFRMLCG